MAQLLYWQRLVLALVSGGLMAIPFLNANYYALTWFAFVPLLVAIEGLGLIRSYLLGLASGLIFSMMAGYWVVDFAVIAKGFGIAPSLGTGFVVWFASAQVAGLMAFALNGLRRFTRQRSPVHDFILIPLILALTYATMPLLFPFHPADTQSRFLSALQAIELTGILGLDALIGLVNAMIYRCVSERRFPVLRPLRDSMPWIIASALMISWFGYGALSTRIWDQKLAVWDTVTIGIVQPNETPTIARPRLYPGYSLAYPPEMEMTRRLASAGAQIVVWPETRYKGYFDQPQVKAAYSRNISEAGVHLLFHDTEKVSDDSNRTLEHNAAMVIRKDGTALTPYHKMKTMPFGESMPLDGSLPILNAISKAVFGDFLESMGQGSEHGRFTLDDLTLVPLICYETMFPGFVSDALAKKDDATILIGLSNNGWFGETVQAYQHTNASILRAVENRVPFVHALNNGPSQVILPNGRILFESGFHEAGGYLVKVPYRAPVSGK